MKINRATLADCSRIRGTVVVIDVLRAFTTAAYAFAAGAKEIILVSEIGEAFALKDDLRNVLLMGEADGLPVRGFDYGNSPSALAGVDLAGVTLVQRTTAGTQGVVRTGQATRILATGLCTAGRP